MSIGHNIRACRLRCGLTLEDVAKRIGLSRQTLSRYETGVIGNIPSDKIEGLAKIFHTTPQALMGWGGDEVERGQHISFGPNAGGFFVFDFGFLDLKLRSINCSLLGENKGICFPDGTLSLTEDVLRDLNEDTDSYLRFKLQELRSKYKDNFTPKEASEAPPVE